MRSPESYVGLLFGAAARELRARLARWRGGAPRRPPAPIPPRIAGRRPRVLVVSPVYPFPPIHGGAVRLTELLRRLGERCELHFLLVAGGTDDPLQRQELGRFCRGVYFHLRTQPGEDPTTAGLPQGARLFRAPLLEERIRSLVSAHRIDIVQLEFTELAGLAGCARPARVVVVEHDIAFRSHRRRALASRKVGEPHDAREWLRWHRHELESLEQVDQIQTMSEEDGRYLARRLSDGARRVRVVPNGANIVAGPASESARPAGTLLFLGSFPHAPNAQGLRYFVDRIWPLLRAAEPGVRLLVCGARPPEWVTALDGHDGIEVAGEVEHLAAVYARSTLMVVPLLSGSGTRLKVLEAMAAGLPVVSTPLGAEGLGLVDGEHLLLADGAKPFADAVLHLLRDPELGRRLAVRSQERVAAEFDWDRIAELNLAAWQELGTVESARGVLGPLQGAHADAESELAVEVMLPLRGGQPPTEEILDALAAQELDVPFAITLLTATMPSPELASTLARRGLSWRLAPGERSLGLWLDGAFAASRAAIFAVLDSCDLPLSSRWLADLVWSQMRSAPPAAALGEILTGDRVPATREEVAASPGFAGLGSNFALRREIWLAFPFGPAVDALSLWPRQLRRAGLFVFSTPDAPVRRAELPRTALAAAAVCAASVVICTRERGPSLEATVRSLARQEAPFGWEILIVDNGSRDGSLELARRLERELTPRLRVVEEAALGLSAARNRGILVARGERIVFLDDDALPEDGWLVALAAALDEPGVLAAGGPIDPLLSGDRPAWLESRYLPYLSAWDRGPAPHDLFYNELPRGTNMAFRREAFERFGSFSRHLGRRGRSLLSCEETEFGLRLERGGARIRYAPAARVQHRIETARLTADFLVARFAAQGRSEAVVDWMHGGWPALRSGMDAGEERVRQATVEQGPAGALHLRCQQASAQAYRREIPRAVLFVPRYLPPDT